MKAFVFTIAMFFGFTHANAQFATATWDIAGQPTQKSFVTLYAIGADAGPQTYDSFLFPSAVNFSNGGIAERAQVDATLTVSLTEIGIDFSRLERRERDTSTNANGAFVFTVTETVDTLASGSLSLLSSGINTENGLWARLFDYTTQEFLFQSSQYDYGHDKTYELGGTVGNRGASFSGSLENTLIAGHIYRFDYLISSGNNGSGDFGSNAVGGFALQTVSAVPEPESYTLMLAGLSLMGVAIRRRKALHY